MLDMDRTSNLPKLNFPAKLHLILSNHEYNDIICWLPHGRAFRVQQQQRLEKEVLPKFFQHQKFASFCRQVTGWGFHRIQSGTDFNAYHHELFLRDAPEVSRRMKRPSRTELEERRQAQANVEPNFYLMPPVSSEANEVESWTDPTKLLLPMSLEEYRERLIRRLSTYSLSEKTMYLQIELNRLDQKKSKIVQQLQNLGLSQNYAPEKIPPPPSSPGAPSMDEIIRLLNERPRYIQ